jgi:hypothetical protein
VGVGVGVGVGVDEIVTTADVSVPCISDEDILSAPGSHATSTDRQKINPSKNLSNLIILAPLAR